jgi:hypothetical protein
VTSRMPERPFRTRQRWPNGTTPTMGRRIESSDCRRAIGACVARCKVGAGLHQGHCRLSGRSRAPHQAGPRATVPGTFQVGVAQSGSSSLRALATRLTFVPIHPVHRVHPIRRNARALPKAATFRRRANISLRIV